MLREGMLLLEQRNVAQVALMGLGNSEGLFSSLAMPLLSTAQPRAR